MKEKRIIVGIFCILLSIALLSVSTKLRKTYPTGYLIGVTVSSFIAFLGLFSLISSLIVLLVLRVEERKREIEERIWKRIEPYANRLKEYLGSKKVDKMSSDLAYLVFITTYREDPKHTFELTYDLKERLESEIPELKTSFHKAFKDLYEKFKRGKWKTL